MAALDPYWGVLTRSENKHGGWNRSVFFASGEQAVEQMLAVGGQFELLQRREVALDFGCGLGRLTRALSRRFGQAYGVDVSGSMIDQAQMLNRDAENCQFRLLDRGDLRMFENESIDLVCSFLVLQHQAQGSAIRAYIREFIRVLRPGGLAVFQIPTHIPLRNRIQPRRRVYSALRLLGVPPSVLYARLGLDPLRMRHLPANEVSETLEQASGKLVAVVDDDLGRPFPSSTYYVTRGG